MLVLLQLVLCHMIVYGSDFADCFRLGHLIKGVHTHTCCAADDDGAVAMGTTKAWAPPRQHAAIAMDVFMLGSGTEL